MKRIQYFVALYMAKSAQLFLKLLGRNASYFPGKVALKFCKDFLAYMTPPKTVIAVTGTNGKTTVSNLLTSILTENGYSVTNNSFGSNVQSGVISALIEDTTIFGKPKKDIAVLEVDERSSLLVYPQFKPDFLICNNIMRDSIKRNAHTEFISYIISTALPASTKLVLNGDDLIAARLGTKGQEAVYFGLEAEKPESVIPQHIRDIVYCPECGNLLEDEYVRYNHIGRHYCKKCGLKSPESSYSVTNIDRENNTFTVSITGSELTECWADIRGYRMSEECKKLLRKLWKKKKLSAKIKNDMQRKGTAESEKDYFGFIMLAFYFTIIIMAGITLGEGLAFAIISTIVSLDANFNSV